MLKRVLCIFLVFLTLLSGSGLTAFAAKKVTAPEKVQNVRVTDKTKTSFIIRWNKVPSADGYIVERQNIETDKWKQVKDTKSVSAKFKAEAKYRVIAYKLSGNKKVFAEPSSKVSAKHKYESSESGTFTFTVYGYGHGVGMSYTGAVYYAEKKGWSYKKILKHYYKGTQIVLDENMPEKVKYSGKKYSLKQYLYRVTQAEVGNSLSMEVLKAQAVAVYSFAKYKNFRLTSNDHFFSKKSEVCSNVKKAVDEVLGEYVSYDGKACLTPYFIIAAGKTASCESTWGGKLPYLVAVDSSCDKKDKNWKTTYTISSEDFKKRFLEDFGVELKGDPSKWIKIISHDKAVSSSIGYVDKVSVGQMVFSGEKFRTSVMHFNLKSRCFRVSYTPDKK